jgi:hypothetical protein
MGIMKYDDALAAVVDGGTAIIPAGSAEVKRNTGGVIFVYHSAELPLYIHHHFTSSLRDGWQRNSEARAES